MIKRWIAICAAMSAIVIACKFGPDYARPKVSVPAGYKRAADESGEYRLGRDWWLLFEDPELNALIDEALKANQDIQAAMARLMQSRAQAAAVRSQFFPVITLNPLAQRSRIPASVRSGSVATATPRVAPSGTPSATPTPAVPGATAATLAGGLGATAGPIRSNFFQIPFDLSYEVDVWGRVRRSYEAATAQTRASAFDLEVVRQTILADVAQNYFNLRGYEEQDRIVLRNVRLYREQLNLTGLQFKAGLVSEVNVYQARAQLEATLAQELDLRRQRDDLEHAIAILLGRPPADFSLPTAPGKITPPEIPIGLPADLLRRRPDIAESEQNLVAANAQIGVEKANLFPALRLTGSGGWESTNSGHLLDWESHFWTIGANVSAPLFEGGMLRANLRQARARYAELEANYRNSVLNAFRDVEDSLNDLRMRADAAQAQARAVDAARGYLNLAEQQYRTGLINYLQVIDADRTLLTNELADAQIHYQRLISTVLLIKALGGGWDAETVATPPPSPLIPPYMRPVTTPEPAPSVAPVAAPPASAVE